MFTVVVLCSCCSIYALLLQELGLRERELRGQLTSNYQDALKSYCEVGSDGFAGICVDARHTKAARAAYTINPIPPKFDEHLSQLVSHNQDRLLSESFRGEYPMTYVSPDGKKMHISAIHQGKLFTKYIFAKGTFVPHIGNSHIFYDTASRHIQHRVEFKHSNRFGLGFQFERCVAAVAPDILSPARAVVLQSSALHVYSCTWAHLRQSSSAGR